jgi:hypothetical protein
MKILGLVAVGLLIAGVVGPAVVSGEPEAEKRATEAAMIWLGLIDGGRYAQSWKDASAYFRGAVTEKSWEASLRGVRAPLGTAQSRAVRLTKEATSLPGAPDGQYVVIELQTSFAAKASAVETVTFVKERDGTWKAAGYFIR